MQREKEAFVELIEEKSQLIFDQQQARFMFRFLGVRPSSLA